MNQVLDNMEFQSAHEPPLVYWHPWRRRNFTCPSVWSQNRIPGFMLHNNATMQFPQMYSCIPPRYNSMVHTQQNMNNVYNSLSNVHVEQQPQFVPGSQFTSTKYIDTNNEILTPPTLSPVTVKLEPEEEIESKFNPTDHLSTSSVGEYDALLPQVMNEVSKRIGHLEVELTNSNGTTPIENQETLETNQPIQSSHGSSIVFQNAENVNYDSLDINRPIIQSPSFDNTVYMKDTLPVGLPTDKQEEVIKAAKSLFSKRTRTLLHWLYPNSSKSQLKGNVSIAWDTIPDKEKNFYISQVLGKFALHNSSLMVNSQLGTAQSAPVPRGGNGSLNKVTEEQSAVNSLFESCDDVEKWTSFSRRTYKKCNSKKEEVRKKRPRKSGSDRDVNKRLFSYDPDLEHEFKLLKKMRKNCQGLDEFEDDSELAMEIEKFRLMSEQIEDDFWDNAPDPDDLFSDLNI